MSMLIMTMMIVILAMKPRVTNIQDKLVMMWNLSGDDVQTFWRWCENFLVMMWKLSGYDVKTFRLWCENFLEMMWKLSGYDVKTFWQWCENFEAPREEQEKPHRKHLLKGARLCSSIITGLLEEVPHRCVTIHFKHLVIV